MKIDSDYGSTFAPAQVARPCVAVVGLGYVGLPTALALHNNATRVVGMDVSTERLHRIRSGEPDLIAQDRARLLVARDDPDAFTLTSDEAALVNADAVIVCVPTPVDDSLTPDLTWLRSACARVVACVRPGQTIILTSTSYVGSTRDLVAQPLSERGFTVGEDVFVAFSPERINPGNESYALADVPRVVGGATAECASRAVAILRRVCRETYTVSSMEAAEMAKLLENTFRAVNISLANEFADVAHHFGLDPIEVIDAAATKPFGFMPFYPGPGVGGHCIPCDPHYLLWQLRRTHVHPSVISAAMQSIATRPARIVERARQVLDQAGKALSTSHILVAGVAYKPDVADTRESPALDIIASLAQRARRVSVYDPVVPRVRIADTVYPSVAQDVATQPYDLIVVCCRHSSMDAELFNSDSPVLDATFSLPRRGNRHLP